MRINATRSRDFSTFLLFVESLEALGRATDIKKDFNRLNTRNVSRTFSSFSWFVLCTSVNYNDRQLSVFVIHKNVTPSIASFHSANSKLNVHN